MSIRGGGKLPDDRLLLTSLAAHFPAQGVGLQATDLSSPDAAGDRAVEQRLADHALELAHSAWALADAVAERYFTPAHALEVRL